MKAKACAKCKKELPATTEYFRVDKRTKSGLQSRCKECNRQYDRRYYEENKDKIAEYKRKYYKENTEHYRKYREENREYYKQYREDNRRRLLKYDRQYYENNKTKHSEYFRQHREDNRELYRSYNQKRRSLKRNLPSTLTTDQWRHAQSYFNHTCAYCGSATALEQDHFWPLSRGGGYTATNIIPVCGSCNSSKHNKLFEEWYPTHESYSPEREAKIYRYLEARANELIALKGDIENVF